MMNNRSGFTLIELSLSIAFIGILSIIVVVLINNAVTSYHRGIILNEINTVGMDLVEDMRLSVQNSEARSLKTECGIVYSSNPSAQSACEEDEGNSFASVVRYTNVKVGKNNEISTPVYGAFCTGEYTYLWNSGYFFAIRTGDKNNILISDSDLKKNGEIVMAELNYKLDGNNSTSDARDFRLLKVRDESRSVCKTAATSNNKYLDMDVLGDRKRVGRMFTLADAIGEEPKDILASQSGLAMYDLTATVGMGESNLNMFYSSSFILATVRGGINVMAAGDFCTPPGGANYDLEAFNYCAINKFNFAAMATGG